jgi:hypothetical protein
MDDAPGCVALRSPAILDWLGRETLILFNYTRLCGNTLCATDVCNSCIRSGCVGA